MPAVLLEADVLGIPEFLIVSEHPVDDGHLVPLRVLKRDVIPCVIPERKGVQEFAIFVFGVRRFLKTNFPARLDIHRSRSMQQGIFFIAGNDQPV